MNFPNIIPFLLFAGLASAAAVSPEVKPARFYYSYTDFGSAANAFQQRHDRYHVMHYHTDDEQLLEVRPGHFPRYGSVLIYGNHGNKIWNETEIGQVEDYVRRGGRLVLAGAAVNLFPPEARRRITGIEPTAAAYPIPFEITALEHPLFQGLEGNSFTASPAGQDASTATPLLSARGRYLAAAENRIGDGRVVTLSAELFPPFGQSLVNGPLKEADLPVSAFVENLLDYLEIPKLEKAVTELSPPGKGLSVWYREPDHEVFSGARRMLPPVPRDESEQIRKLTATLGLRDTELLPFYLTLGEGKGSVTISPQGNDKESNELAGRFRLFTLGRVPQEASGPEVFVQEHPAEGGSFTVPAPASADTITFLLRLDSEGLKPGLHRCELRITRDGSNHALPVEIQVADVRLPDYPLHHLEVEHNGLGQQVRSREGVDSRKLQIALRSMKDLGADHLMAWPFPPVDSPTLTLDERLPLPGLFTPENRDRVAQGDLPDIDYSQANAYFDAAVEAGLIIYRNYYHAGGRGYLELFSRALGGKKVSPNDPECAAFLRWAAAQRRQYLREKGYAMAYLKWGDEWGPRELDRILSGSAPLREAGWKIVVNPSGKTVLSSPEFRGRVVAGTDLLQLGDGMEWYFQALREMAAQRKIVAPDGLMTILTSSWWWNQSTATGFLYGYAMANAGIRGAHFHGWWRDWKNRQPFAGVYIDRETFEVIPSLGLVYFGQGVRDAQYLTLARQLIRRGEAKGLNLEPMRTRLSQIIGGPGAILPMAPDRHFNLGIDAPERADGGRLSLADYRRAKEALIGLLTDLQKAVGPLPSALRWGDRMLWDPESGETLTVYHTPSTREAAEQFAETLKAKSAVPPQVEVRAFEGRIPFAKATAFLIVDNRDEPAREAVSQLYPGIRMRPHYPAPESYAVFEPTEANVIVLAGNGPEGIGLGTRLFPKFIEGTLEWKNEPVPGPANDSPSTL